LVTGREFCNLLRIVSCDGTSIMHRQYRPFTLLRPW